MELMFKVFFFGAVTPHLRAVGLDSYLAFRIWKEPPGEDGRGWRRSGRGGLRKGGGGLGSASSRDALV